MSEKELKQGDRVRITLVGSVRYVDLDDGFVWIRSASSADDFVVLAESVERLDA